MIVKILLIFLSFIATTRAATIYHCVAIIKDLTTGQTSCPTGAGSGPIKEYPKIGRCCSTDSNDYKPPLKVTQYQAEPPDELPLGCDLGEHRPSDSKYVCVSGKENAFANWHSATEEFPICCQTDIISKPPTGGATIQRGSIRRIPQANLEIIGAAGVITRTTTPSRVPAPPPTTTTRRPFLPFPRPRSRASTAACMDLAVPGRPSDCPAMEGKCNDPMWSSLLAQQCPFTCKLCGQQGRQRQPIDRHIGGGRGCRDWIPPAGHLTCPEMVGMGYCQNRRTQMMAQCPLLCGFCQV